MGVTKSLAAFFLVAGVACAQPRLRLSSTTAGPVAVAVGGTASTTIEAFNAGSGALNLTVRSAYPWLTGQVGAPRACTTRPGSCLPITLTVNATGQSGTIAGVVTVSDPAAWDAPQTITVVAVVGGTVPDRLTLIAPVGGSATTSLVTGQNAVVNSNQPWVTVNLEGGGTIGFIRRFAVTARAPQPTAGTFPFELRVTGSAFAGDNKTVQGSLVTTAGPIASVSPERLIVRCPAAAPAQRQFVVLANRGGGTLDLTSVSATPAPWLRASRLAGTTVVEAEVTCAGQAPGVYSATITVAGNFAGGSVTVPVTLEITPPGAGPLIAFGGIVNNANFGADQPLAPGGLAVAFGEQFTFGAPTTDATWPGSLNGVSVFVNGVRAPVFYVSYNQINFQVPLEVSAGDAFVQVTREGTPGNVVTVPIAASQPRIMEWSGLGGYGIIVNSDGTLPLPETIRLGNFISRPATAGDTLVVYALGYGATIPAVGSGQVSPASPLAQVPGDHGITLSDTPGLLGQTVNVRPFFVGLTPGFVGLFQINVTLPPGIPTGNRTYLRITSNGVSSNTVQLATR